MPETVKSVELSADMEEKLADIESGKISPSAVLQKFEVWIKSQIETQAGQPKTSLYSQKEREIIGKCLKCGGDVVEVNNPKLQAFCCNNKDCKFILWKKQFGNEKAVSKTTAKQLLTKRKSGLVKGFISKAGKEYSAFLVMKDDFSVGLDFGKK